MHSSNSSFVEDGASINWITLDHKGERVRKMRIDKAHWKSIQIDFYQHHQEHRFVSIEDFESIFNKTLGTGYPSELVHDAHEQINRQRREGKFLENTRLELRQKCKPGELTISFAKCHLGDRSHPKCCMNNLKLDKDEDMGPVTSTPKPCRSRTAPGPDFGDVTPVVPGTSSSFTIPPRVDTSRSSDATALGSAASSRRTSTSSDRSARATSTSSQDSISSRLFRRETPKRRAPRAPNNSSNRTSFSRGTQAKKTRVEEEEEETGLVVIKYPRTAGFCSPNMPESSVVDYSQPSTSGTQPPKSCHGKATKGCASSQCSQRPCHEELF